MSSMKSVTFQNPEQFNLIIRQVRKLYEHKNMTDPRAVRRKQDEYRLLKSLLNKLEPVEAKAQEGTQEVIFNRKEIRALQSICVNGTRLLTEFIIPGYTTREENESDEKQRARYVEYRARAESAKTIYASLLEQLNL